MLFEEDIRYQVSEYWHKPRLTMARSPLLGDLYLTGYPLPFHHLPEEKGKGQRKRIYGMKGEGRDYETDKTNTENTKHPLRGTKIFQKQKHFISAFLF